MHRLKFHPIRHPLKQQQKTVLKHNVIATYAAAVAEIKSNSNPPA